MEGKDIQIQQMKQSSRQIISTEELVTKVRKECEKFKKEGIEARKREEELEKEVGELKDQIQRQELAREYIGSLRMKEMDKELNRISKEKEALAH